MSVRLNVIIRLLLEHFKKDSKQTVGDQIVFLESAGLESKDVADILGIEVNQLTSYRRSATTKKKPKQWEETQDSTNQDQTGVQT